MVSTANDLDMILAQIEQLSAEDLLNLQEHITAQLRQKISSATNGHIASPSQAVANGQALNANEADNKPDIIHPYPGSSIYRYTEKGIKKLLGNPSPEEMERIRNFDPASLPETSIPMSEMVNRLRGTIEE